MLALVESDEFEFSDGDEIDRADKTSKVVLNARTLASCLEMCDGTVGEIIGIDDEGENVSEETRAKIDMLLKQHFRPEFLNRIDETVMFQKLGKECLGGIVRIQLERVAKRLEDRRISIDFDEKAINFLSEKGYDPAFGARPVKRAVQTWLENPLSRELLAGKYLEGAKIQVSADGEKLVFC